MEKLLSSRSTDDTIPEKYVFSPEKRPGELVIPEGMADVPIINLQDENTSRDKIMRASQDFGLFQVINHGVPRALMDETMQVCEEFFSLSPEEKSKINKVEDTNGICKFYTSSYNYDTEETHYWRDVLRHSCNPLEECIKFWPQRPERYREIVGEYVIMVRYLGSMILELISQGLGLERDYLKDELSKDAFLIVNHYPPCPDPRLTLGLSKHSDPNLITILLLGQVPGLQVLRDGKWLGVETQPDAILVIIGNQLKVVSNGKLNSAVHRAVTNSSKARTSAALFINPSMDCIVEPAKDLIAAENSPPLCRPFLYKDFFKAYTGPYAGNVDKVLEAFKINP